MSSFLSRRKFISGISAGSAGLYLGMSHASFGVNPFWKPAGEEELLDWSDWELYSNSVQHPCLTIKQADIDCARENSRKYRWAGEYTERVERNAQRYLHLVNSAFLEKMIGETTPGHPRMTPCPACRDKGKPYYPHGLWSWHISNPDQLSCDVCGTVFPDNRYPEDIEFHTRWGRPQTITYCGGDTFTVFGYKNGRPGFNGNIRSRKVQWIANYCRTLAEAYILSENHKYALTCRNILLRLAECYPFWLVHVGYGEYADMDPRIAAQNINKLPEPEICPPPGEPDFSLWTGFWSAGRSTGTGLESDFVRKTVEAYDLTCNALNQDGNRVYSENDRKKIERDLLLESTILLVCDKQINNKSVSNRTAAALVGMCVGHPGLVRFGLESFNKTVGGWYLPDGTTSESPFYGLMTLGGIWDMAQASLGYTDPPGYLGKKSGRIESLDLYNDTPYYRVWEAFFNGLQGDFHYPPYADSFRSTNLDVSYIELMVASYPEKTQYLSLLKTLCGKNLELHSGSREFIKGDLSGVEDEDDPVLDFPYGLTKPNRSLSFSLYYRKPGLEDKASPELRLPDWCPSSQRIAHLRTGADGRESLMIVSASDWGIHHGRDSLNLYYWKNNCEILSDLGYLWDHPDIQQNRRTLAHNTVIIDEKDQVGQNRGGEVLYFEITGNVKLIEMSSSAYPEAKLYRRTSAIIDHGGGKNYVVDFFRVEGGKKQDYIFHGIESSCQTHNIELQSLPAAKVYDFKNVRSADGNRTWKATWRSGKEMNCAAWSAGQEGETVYIADGWGQRDFENSDLGATIPYIVRQYNGEGVKTFISVFEGFEGNESFVRGVKLIDNEGIVEVNTAIGTDYIMSVIGTGTLKSGKVKGMKKLSGHFVAATVQNKKMVWNVIVEEKK
jgi:hypothetical protein